ncbi:MAG TPA: hypothetical protein VG367_08845 [Mucilaginibacter sp.]|jgi:hypothetical protein|nr:hypothetical protein [Mucilaginibacter sp.]
MAQQSNKETLSITKKQLFITSAVTILGIFIGGLVNEYVDKSNKLREIKIDYLIDAFTKLANGSQRPMNAATYHRDFELAIAKIQLFGSDSEIKSLDSCLDASRLLSTKDTVKLNVDNVLMKLRNSLRCELGLNQINSNVRWFRFSEGDSVLSNSQIKLPAHTLSPLLQTPKDTLRSR